MGSSHPSNSTRAGKAHLTQTPSRRKRAPPGRSRALLEPLRDAKRLKAPPSSSGATASAAQPPEPANIGRAAGEALREIHRRLEIAGTIAYICAATLRAQMTGYGTDIALRLQRLVGDEIDRQMKEIDRLLGRERTYQGGDEDAGGAV